MHKWETADMKEQTGNLSTAERILSGAIGSALTLLAMQRGRPLLRMAAGIAGSAMLTRAAAGHCAAKSALLGHSTLTEGIKDQWCHLTKRSGRLRDGLPGSPVHSQKSEAVDQSVEESFPASDPPASHLPDEPPANADAKWAAARAAGRVR
jgi:hypothetical protein